MDKTLNLSMKINEIINLNFVFRVIVLRDLSYQLFKIIIASTISFRYVEISGIENPKVCKYTRLYLLL